MYSLRMSFWIVPVSLSERHALLEGRDDVEGHDRQHGAVHGHRHRHPVQRDAVEEDLHVLDRVDGDARLAHVAHHPRVVAVVAAVGGQVEGHRQALLAGGQVAAVEGVGLLGGREAGVLAHRPRPGHVHAWRTVRAGTAAGRAGSPGARSRRRPRRCRAAATGICSLVSQSGPGSGVRGALWLSYCPVNRAQGQGAEVRQPAHG